MNYVNWIFGIAILCQLVFIFGWKHNNYSQRFKNIGYAGILMQLIAIISIFITVEVKRIDVGFAVGIFSLVTIILHLIRDHKAAFIKTWQILAFFAAIGCLLSVLDIRGQEFGGISVHFVFAALAYGFFFVSIAQMIELQFFQGKINYRDSQIPQMSLLDMEENTFSNVKLGFIFLTLTIMSGIIAGILAEEDSYVAWGHKTLFAIFTWITSCVLLICRWKFGWRGVVALRWHSMSVIFLVLSYIATRVVLDIVLER